MKDCGVLIHAKVLYCTCVIGYKPCNSWKLAAYIKQWNLIKISAIAIFIRTIRLEWTFPSFYILKTEDYLIHI